MLVLTLMLTYSLTDREDYEDAHQVAKQRSVVRLKMGLT